MKKLLLLPAIIVFVVPAFAQEENERWDGNRRMAVTINLGPLFLGAITGGFGISAGFEYAPIEFASARLNVHYIGFNYPDSSGSDSIFRLNLDGRWYPQGNAVRNWFLNGGLQFQRLSESFMDSEAETTNALSFVAGVGYKVVFRSSQRAAFVMEPALGFVWLIASNATRSPYLDDALFNFISGVHGVRRGFRSSNFTFKPEPDKIKHGSGITQGASGSVRCDRHRHSRQTKGRVR